MGDVLLRLDVVETAAGALPLGGAFGQVYGTVEITFDRNVTVTGAGQSFGQLPRVLNLPDSGFLDVPITTCDDARVTAGSGFATLLTFRLHQRAMAKAPLITVTEQIQVTAGSVVSVPVGGTDPITGQPATLPILLLSQQPPYVPPSAAVTGGNLTIVSTDPTGSSPGNVGDFQINQVNGNVWEYSA